MDVVSHKFLQESYNYAHIRLIIYGHLEVHEQHEQEESILTS
jgi:hypothetical protein